MGEWKTRRTGLIQKPLYIMGAMPVRLLSGFSDCSPYLPRGPGEWGWNKPPLARLS